MSTRCNVIIKDEYNKIILYRHSDGYPECVGIDLKDFVKGYTDGSMRLDAMQSSGWLILRGNAEYNNGNCRKSANNTDRFMGWKVGAYEPTTSIHGDILYLYVIDLKQRKLCIYNGDKAIKSKNIEIHSF